MSPRLPNPGQYAPPSVIATADGIALLVPGMRLVNPTNEHAHWRDRSTRARAQRGTVKIILTAYAHRVTPPLIVTIVRMGPGTLDSDSLPPSGKHVRDGVADAWGIDDGDEAVAEWRYRQVRTREWGTRIEITTRPGPRTDGPPTSAHPASAAPPPHASSPRTARTPPEPADTDATPPQTMRSPSPTRPAAGRDGSG